MSINRPYRTTDELANVIPVFPLGGALLLPRGQMPLNIFEPRYIAMIDDSIKSHRLIGMVQPSAEETADLAAPTLHNVGCVGRITQFAETGDGRYLMSLTGIARFRIAEELTVMMPYRQCRVDYSSFESDLVDRAGEDDVDRVSVISALRKFADLRQLRIDWKEIERAHNEMLVNALSMICPFGTREKQALLEACDLKTRAQVLVAITEMETARGDDAPSTLQ
jgi:Lon protease-like protein